MRGVDIRARIEEITPEIRACYERELAGDQGPSGTLKIGFEIGPEGRVHRARFLEGSLPNAEVQRCALRVFESITFDPPVDGWMKVAYPLFFSKSEGDVP